MDETETRIKLLYGTTSGVSVDYLLAGQLDWFADRGYRVSVVSDFSTSNKRLPSRVRGINIGMAREISLIKDLRSLLSWIVAMRRESPDVASISTPKASLLGLCAARLVRVPRRVYVVRGLRFEGATGLQKRILSLTERVSCALATDIVAVGFGVARGLRSVTSKYVYVVGDGSSNGCDASRFESLSSDRKVRSTVRRSLGFEEGAVVVMFAGRPDPDKGFDQLAAAVASLGAELPLLCVLGVGIGSEYEAVLPPGSKCVGWVNDVAEYFPAADIFVLPTKREGFPNVVLEAGAAGLPVITTDATGADESVVEMVTGIKYPSAATDQLAAAIRFLATSPSERSRMGIAAQARVKQRFSPDRIWSGLDSIYRGQGASNSDISVIACGKLLCK